MRGDSIGVYAFKDETRMRAKGRHMLAATRRVSLLHVAERVGNVLIKFEHVSRAPG